MQRIFFYIAPPFAVVFLLGLLWRRANATAAVVTIVSGFVFLALLQKGIPLVDRRVPAAAVGRDCLAHAVQAAYQHSALLTWIFCMIVMIVDVAPDGAAAARAGRADHLEPQLSQSCRPTSATATAAGRTFASGGCCSSSPCWRSTGFSCGSTLTR